MKQINFIFRVHQRVNLKRYRFFDIGNDHYYYDDYAEEAAVRQFTDQCYLEANRTLLEMINSSNGKFRVSFAISGLALEQFERYAPEVIESFQELAKTGAVEFIATPNAHSLASVFNADEFVQQTKLQTNKIKQLFGKTPTTFANTALIYSDEIGEQIAKMGYKTIVIEGAKHIMGWKSPHYVYSHAFLNKVKLLVRDNKLSDDINYRFSQWNWNEFPLTAEKFVGWLNTAPAEEEIFNIFLGYEALGVLNQKNSGIFEFFKALPYHAMLNGIGFSTPSESAAKAKPADTLTVTHPISWADEEKDLSAYCANDLQNEALNKLYSVAQRVHLCDDLLLKIDWQRLQDTSHFFCMTTKHYSNGAILAEPITYESPYDAFMNYMNVLSDFMARVEAQYPTTIENEELNALLQTISNQEKEIAALEKKLAKTTKKTEKAAK